MRPELCVVLEERVLHRIVPDVVVSQRPERKAASGATILAEPPTTISDGIEMRVHTDPLRHHFVEVRDASRAHKLIALIEIVSPANKRPVPDRRSYDARMKPNRLRRCRAMCI
jgi:hypothetical protein